MFERSLILLWILAIIMQLTLLLFAITLFMFMVWEFRNQRKHQNEKKNVKQSEKEKEMTAITESSKAEQSTDMFKSMEDSLVSVPESNEKKKSEKYIDVSLEVNEEKDPLTDINKEELELFITNSLNHMLKSNGYNKYVDENGFKIGIGDGRNDIGDEILLKEGNGNIKIVFFRNGLYYGAPDKVTWKGIDLSQGTFHECYISPSGVDNGSDYTISQIIRPAVLTKENGHFKVEQKGEVAVKVK